MPRIQKQSDGLKKYKETKQRNKINAILWAKLRLVNGVDRNDIIAGMVERYGYAERTAADYLKRAEHMATQTLVKDTEKIISKNLARLDAIAEAAADSDDYNNAIKAIDTLNKMSGAYVDKKEVKIDATEIKFEFGNIEDGGEDI